MIRFNRRNLLVGLNYIKNKKEHYDNPNMRFEFGGEKEEKLVPTPENTVDLGELKQEDEETVTNSLLLKIKDIGSTIEKLKKGEIS